MTGGQFVAAVAFDDAFGILLAFVLGGRGVVLNRAMAVFKQVT